MDPIHPITARRREPSPVEVVLRQPRTSLRERDERQAADERRRRRPAQGQPAARSGAADDDDDDDDGASHIDVLA